MKKREMCSFLFIITLTIYYTVNGSLLYANWMRSFIYISLFLGMAGIIQAFYGKLKTFLIIAILFLSILLLFLRNGDTRMLIAGIGIFACYTIDTNRIISVVFYTKMVCFILVLLAGGYNHINGTAGVAGLLILLYLCKQEEIKVREICMVILIYAIFSAYTKSGNFIICIGITIILTCLQRTTLGKKILESKFVWFFYPFCFFCNYFFAAGIGENQMIGIGRFLPTIINHAYVILCNVLDEWTSYRLTLVKYSFAVFGVSFWGGNVDYSLLELGENGYFNLDSGFIWLLQGWGICMSVIFMVMSVLLMWYLSKTERYSYIIAGIVIALWSINEDVLVGVGANFLILLWGHAIRYFMEERRILKHEHT